MQAANSATLGTLAAQTPPSMPRRVLDQSRIHPAIRDAVANHHADIVHNVQAATLSNTVLVVGMAMNPHCRRARKLLATAGVSFHYLEYGGYFSQWRDRNALKMWTGWPTFPMVFVKSTLVGGASNVARLIDSGELKRMLSA